MTVPFSGVEQRLKKIIRNNPILPVKVKDGILVGTVLISSNGHLKNIVVNNQIVYKEVSLNKVAIKLANILAKMGVNYVSDELYKLDQEYGRWFTESQMLRAQHQKATLNQDYDRADMLWARYVESRDKMITAKNRAESLSHI